VAVVQDGLSKNFVLGGKYGAEHNDEGIIFSFSNRLQKVLRS
jgi:hypothetical protein